MNSQEFNDIVGFLESGSIPDAAKLSAQRQWNFRRKAGHYTLSEVEPNRLFKVRNYVIKSFLNHVRFKRSNLPCV